MTEHRSCGATVGTTWTEHHVELGGVRTWYGEQGAGDPLVLLHPGLVDARAFGANLAVWSARFHTFTPERRGHGHTPDVEGPLTFEQMAADTAGFIETVVGGPTRLLGVSDGAIVALVTAVRRPDLVTRLVAISGPAHHHGWLPQAIDPANQAPAFMHQAYGEVSPDGIEHYPVVLAKMAQAHLVEPTLGPADLARIACRTLVMLGDDDEVHLEHAVELYRALLRGELAVVPGTSHGLLVEKPELCDRIILDFLEGEAVATLAPIRRR
jgi:pimeloyl-ACP methyl ester carboxylesterase